MSFVQTRPEGKSPHKYDPQRYQARIDEVFEARHTLWVGIGILYSTIIEDERSVDRRY